MTKINGKSIKIELSEEEINQRINQINKLDCDDDLRSFLVDALRAIIRLDEIVGMKNTTIARLRKIFGKKTEKKFSKKSNSSNSGKSNGGKKGREKGQGNNGKNSYPNAPTVTHSIDNDKSPGELCIECGKGTLHKYEPGIYIRISGSPSLRAIIHETEKTRCNACGTIFEATFQGKDKGKYDDSAISIVAILHYLASMPFYRLEKIQKHLLTPMPRSVQWSLMEKLANTLIFVWKALIKHAKEKDLFFVDDTKVKIQSIIANNKKTGGKKMKGKKPRVAMYTTGIIAKDDEHQCILYFSGQKYSGENLSELLSDRKSNEAIAIMSDALKNNNPDTILKVIKYLCLVHGRRNFIDLQDKFQKEVDFVLNSIALVYKHEKYCKENKLSPDERLEYHQIHSGPVMNDLKKWCHRCIDDKLVEPNSSLGKAINYLINHWKGLTGFLRDSGAPIDNNLLESHLRTPVLNKKNWLFYKNEMGALVGDIILSILKTCEINKVDPYQYLNYIQKNKELVKKNPYKFFPWNIKKLLGQADS